MKRAACCRPRKRQPSTSTIDPPALFNWLMSTCLFQPPFFYWLTSTTALFNLPFSTWSTSTILSELFWRILPFSPGRRRPAFFNLVDVLVDRQRSSTSILQLFSSRPKNMTIFIKAFKNNNRF